jgi:hypothetical protein
MLITARGHGLQVFLAKFHLLQIWLEEYEPEPPPVFAVVAPDTASAHNLESRVGMLHREPPPELAAVRGAAGVPFVAGKRVLFATAQNFADAVADLRRWHRAERSFQAPKGNSLVQVELGWFSPAVLSALT